MSNKYDYISGSQPSSSRKLKKKKKRKKEKTVPKKNSDRIDLRGGIQRSPQMVLTHGRNSNESRSKINSP